MGVGTFSAAVHITPTVLKTFFKHYSRKTSKIRKGTDNEEVTDDILYDEAFNIVKSFIELGTLNTVESLQKFTNTHIISPPWAAVAPVLIPLTSCNDAADILIKWFSPEELKKVVGGERWWQVRGLDGVDAEWVTEKKFLREDVIHAKGKQKAKETDKELSSSELDIVKMDSLEKVLLYIHGGAYFWGSINTHRYQIIKYARKIKGRAFAVNYRKAPQYPWPCPLHDVIAAYLYLIRPPPSALHSPISPSNIVVAGDSAGGGLALSLLTVLRDMELPMPAGAVLISPWVDLTHSFPSVMNNINTDIIPEHGFIHKPSVLWPMEPVPKSNNRITETESAPPPKPGHADTLKPDQERMAKAAKDDDSMPAAGLSQDAMLHATKESSETRPRPGSDEGENSESTVVASDDSTESKKMTLGDKAIDGQSGWDPKPPKILMEDSSSIPLELRSQIQLYATNEQLTHPLVSPILHGSLGNLPPLYIIAGDHEALRDEIIYLAHRAAYPEQYPPRMEAVRESQRQMQNMEKFKTPTKVHLQVFDGMCHVLTVFTFQSAVKYAYRSIAEFVKHLTDHSESRRAGVAFPEIVIGRDEDGSFSDTSNSSSSSVKDGKSRKDEDSKTSDLLKPSSNFKSLAPGLSLSSNDRSAEKLYEENKAETKELVQEHVSENKVVRETTEERAHDTGASVLDVDEANVIMIRQRVDIRGRVRQMEPMEELACLQVPRNEVGLLREAPARRWQTGQALWDKRFKAEAKKVEKKRKKNEEQYENTIQRARELGLVHTNSMRSVKTDASSSYKATGTIQKDRRWGPLDLDGEDPPPSAIAARRDNPESVALLRKTVYHTAPMTIRKMPKRKMKDVVKAAFDPKDDPKAAPKQSVSEQQHSAELGPLHGLKIWSVLMGYFGERSSHGARKGKRKATSGLKKISAKFGNKTSTKKSKEVPADASSAPTD